MRRHLIGYAFISPWLLGFLVFTAIPFVVSLYLSFTRYQITTNPAWVGPTNYVHLFTRDQFFLNALWVTIKYAIVAVPLGIACGVGLALLLNLEIAGISVYRTIFYLPSIVPVVATSTIFLWILNPNPQVGLVNGLLRHLGIIGPNWLMVAPWAFRSLVIMSLWGIGGSMIIYLAGLKDIPVSLYEAAKIDGANVWQRTRHVTLPMLTPVIFFNLVMGIIAAFQYFTQAYVIMTADGMAGIGGPEDSTYFYALYLFNKAWNFLDMGYASAMAWVLFVIVMVTTGLVFLSHRKWVHYGN